MNEDALLDELTSGIHAVVGDALVGIYLYGSYVSGGFDPGVSDLDLVTVSSIEVDTLDLERLERVHRQFVGSHREWTDRIEVVYIGRSTLRSFRTSVGRLAVISPGEPFHLRDDRVAEWVQNWYLVHETGVALYGPPAPEVVPPVALSEFVAAAARYTGQVSGQSLQESGPGQLAYAVLTMCRAYVTVKTQAHCSKQEAAALIREQMPEWAWLIDEALRCRLSRGTAGFDDPETRAAAESLVAFLAAEVAGDLG